MNAKNDIEYIHEEAPTESWIKSKAGKLTVLIVGGVVALGAAFGTGISVGSEFGHGGLGIAGFDRDGDHKFNGQFPGGDGQRPPRPGDQDGGQFNPNPQSSQAPSTQNG